EDEPAASGRRSASEYSTPPLPRSRERGPGREGAAPGVARQSVPTVRHGYIGAISEQRGFGGGGQAMKAFFGAPQPTFMPGGTHITVTLVPVFEGRLLVFDVHPEQARGRWLPWDVLDLTRTPYEAASILCDDWCEGAIRDLSLADVMSFALPDGGHELAIVF